MNRETWLKELSKNLSPIFGEHSHTIPENIRFSCGFTSRGIRSNCIGEVWDQEASDDNNYEIFIHPKLIEPTQIAATLVHELVHVVVGVKEKHNKVFKKLATKVGLEGKMTATFAGLDLTDKLKKVLESMEKYPHAKLKGSLQVKKERGKNSFKVVCGKCDFTAKVGKKHIDLELPTHCGESMTLDELEDLGD